MREEDSGRDGSRDGWVDERELEGWRKRVLHGSSRGCTTCSRSIASTSNEDSNNTIQKQKLTSHPLP